MTERDVCELLEAKQYKKIKEIFADMNQVDLAELLEELPERQMIKAFRLIGKEEAAETFSCMESREQQILVEALTLTICSLTIRRTFWKRCRLMWWSGSWQIRIWRPGGSLISF